MNRTKAYMNRLVKIKEQEIEDTYHETHLKEMKPRSKKLMEHTETIVINHGKREMIKQVREIQIERENKLLLQKIAGLMGKKGAYSVAKTKNIRTKVNKSLNEIYRKRQLQNIQLENKRFLQRLQTKRPTLNMQKMNKEWIQNKSMLKRMANADFYLTNIQSSGRMRSITAQKFNKSKYEKMRLIKGIVVDGHKMLIKIEFVGEFLKIVADTQDKRDIKIIEIPKDEAMILIQKDCQGKFQLLFQKLKYDNQSQTLYIVSESLEDQEVNISDFNPQIDRIFSKTQSNTKRLLGQENRDKIAASKGMINHSIKQKSNQNEKEKEKEKTINNQVQEKQKPQVKKEKLNNQKKINPPIQESKVQANNIVQKEQKPVIKQDHKEIQHKQIQKKNQQVVKKQDQIVVKEIVKVEPQEEQKYEEQNFEELLQKQEVRIELHQKKITKQQHKEEKEIIVQPESAQNYQEQFQVSGQVIPQKIAQNQKKNEV